MRTVLLVAVHGFETGSSNSDSKASCSVPSESQTERKRFIRRSSIVPTFKLTIAYDGTDYCGWQVQKNGKSIQETIERALQKIILEEVRVTASGRTDSGVHALAQVASVKMHKEMTCNTLQRALNGNLPLDIRILHCEPAVEDFHAIRDAKRKRYRYHINDARIHDVFRRRYAWHVYRRLDHVAMHTAAQGLVGEHDFRTYEAAGSDRKTSVRTIYTLHVERQNTAEMTIEVEANGFLYMMVRNIVGTLVEVGRGSQSVEWPADILTLKNRSVAGDTAPACGLFLVDVTY